MWETIESIVHFIASICVVGILIVEADDVYGLTALRKITKRKLRKFHRQFMKSSKKYFKKKEETQT